MKSANKDWNILAVVDEKEYLKPAMTALEEQNMHDTDQYTMPTVEYNKKNGIKSAAVQPIQVLAVTNTTLAANKTSVSANVTANLSANATSGNSTTVKLTANLTNNATKLVQANSTAKVNASANLTQTANASANIIANATANSTGNATSAAVSMATMPPSSQTA